MMYLRYLKYVLVHKYYVFIECCKLGIPWRGITHDLSKFSRAEFGPYARKFWGGPYPSEIVAEDGQVTCEQVKQDFGEAWRHHQLVNDHHPGHWVKKNGVLDLPPDVMPEPAVREMVADHKAMSRTQRNTVINWYKENKKTIRLHPDTRQYYEFLIEYDGDT